MYYKYTQNNSGGSFITNDKVAETVIIEAHSPLEANAIAEEIGIYFDGCATGEDCSCCGDRWYRVEDFYASEKLDVDEWEVKRRKVYLYTDTGKNKIVVTEATMVAIDGKEEPSEPVVEDNPPVETRFRMKLKINGR
jgi:hypothetical protein